MFNVQRIDLSIASGARFRRSLTKPVAQVASAFGTQSASLPSKALP